MDHTSLQTSQLLKQKDDDYGIVPTLSLPGAPTSPNPLSMELGWPEVSSGLGRMLTGYLLSIFGPAAGAMILVIAVAGVAAGKKISKADALTVELSSYAAIVVMLFTALIGYYMIWSGYFRCLINCPDRYGARWFIFSSLLCLTVSPALNLASLATAKGTRNYAAMSKGAAALEEILLSDPNTLMQLVAVAAAIANAILFILFLRAIAKCFDNLGCIMAGNLYLVFTALLIAGTIWLVVNYRIVMKHPQLLGLLLLGALVNLAYFLVLLFVNRLCIIHGYQAFQAKEQGRTRGR